MKKKPEKLDLIKHIINNFKTKHKYGFTYAEMLAVLASFPDITKEQLDTALGVRTVMVIDNETITYHSDLELALRCITEKRTPNVYEFD